MNPNAEKLLKSRYCWPGEQPVDVYKRVCGALSLKDEQFENDLYTAMVRGDLLPNSPCLRNAGKKNGMLHACFTLPILDDIYEIFDTVRNMAAIFHYGGGVGINFSSLRPRNDPLSTGGTSSGALSFMQIFDMVTDTVRQGGFRRGALMGILWYYHPEIISFISAKLQGRLSNFNLSVMVDDKFYELVDADGDVELRWGRKTYGRIGARELMDLISFSAWHCGDPGMLFFDRINKDNKLYPNVVIDTCNPCSETPLPVYGACCLGSINLSNLVHKGMFDWTRWIQLLELGTKMLLRMNLVGWYPLRKIQTVMRDLNPIGLGVMGFADALIKMGIRYDSEDTLQFIRELGKEYKRVTEHYAQGSFYKRIIAPTGSLSILGDCSSSIEPVFSRAFERSLDVDMGVVVERRELYDSAVTRTAHEISPEWHLAIQMEWQKIVDGGISKTINLPNNVTLKQIKDIYHSAWKGGVKGITVFRDGCKEGVFRPLKCDGGECHL